MLVMYFKQWELLSTDVGLSLILPLTNTVTSEKLNSLNFSSPLGKKKKDEDNTQLSWKVLRRSSGNAKMIPLEVNKVKENNI